MNDSRPLQRKDSATGDDSVGNVSNQFVLLIGGLAASAHFKVYLFKNDFFFSAAEDSAGRTRA